MFSNMMGISPFSSGTIFEYSLVQITSSSLVIERTLPLKIVSQSAIESLKCCHGVQVLP